MKYTVLKAVQLPAGTQVKFSDEQAERRGGQVSNVKGKLYECLVPVWVKAGETIELDAPAKHLLARLDPHDKAAARKPSAKQDTPPPAATQAPELSGSSDGGTLNAAPSASDPAAE